MNKSENPIMLRIRLWQPLSDHQAIPSSLKHKRPPRNKDDDFTIRLGGLGLSRNTAQCQGSLAEEIKLLKRLSTGFIEVSERTLDLESKAGFRSWFPCLRYVSPLVKEPFTRKGLYSALALTLRRISLGSIGTMFVNVFSRQRHSQQHFGSALHVVVL